MMVRVLETFAFLQEDLTKETLHKQYQLVKSHTNTSHVMQYGNKVSRALAGLTTPKS